MDNSVIKPYTAEDLVRAFNKNVSNNQTVVKAETERTAEIVATIIAQTKRLVG